MSLSRASTNLHSNMPALDMQLDSTTQHVLDSACVRDTSATSNTWDMMLLEPLLCHSSISH